MKHTPDQDLLLLAHRSLGPIGALSARLHLRQCDRCRGRYAELSSLTRTAARAFRLGMPAWKPLGMAAGTKLLLGVIIFAGALLMMEISMFSPHYTVVPGGNLVLSPVGKEELCKVALKKAMAANGQPAPAAPQKLRGPGTVTLPQVQVSGSKK